MAVREILRYPHPSLQEVARPAGEADAEDVVRVADDLVETMRAHAGCVGLAAPQIDELVRVVVVDVSEHKRGAGSHGLLVLVDPVVVEATGEEIAREGCLSLPELTANVRRATRVVVEALTPAAGRRVIESTGFEARCLQHELDHLDGVLFLDRVDSLATDVFRRQRYR